MLTKKKIGNLGVKMVRSIKQELREQRHVLTRKVLNSIQATTTTTEDGSTLEITADRVAEWLENGRKAGKLPNYANILDWVIARGLPRTNSGRTTRSANKLSLQRTIAFKIMKAIGKKGTPLKGSYKFSRNGARKGFIKRGIERFNIENELNFDEIFKDFVISIFGANG